MAADSGVRNQANTVDTVIAQLEPILGQRATTDAAVCEQHGHDESWHHPSAPDAVCFPETNDEVSAIVRACSEQRVPVMAYGVGTSLEGHIIEERGGICVDLSHMNGIHAVRTDDMDATVEAGVTRTQLTNPCISKRTGLSRTVLSHGWRRRAYRDVFTACSGKTCSLTFLLISNAHLRDTGLFFSVDPGADASLGGMASTRASGTNTVRYGTIRDNVRSLTVVMPDGSVVRTGARAKKSAAGYDLTNLLIGAEGTLGIITELDPLGIMNPGKLL